MPKTNIPNYRLHRASGQAFVELGGRFYLGKHGSKASCQTGWLLVITPPEPPSLGKPRGIRTADWRVSRQWADIGGSFF